MVEWPWRCRQGRCPWWLIQGPSGCSNSQQARFKKAAARVCSPSHQLTTGRGPAQIAALLFGAPYAGERSAAPCGSSVEGFNSPH